MERTHRLPLLTSLRRSQVAAFIASIVDFTTLLGLVEQFGLWYVHATAIAALVGAGTNFALGRYWSFQAVAGKVQHQALRYALTALLSAGLNTGGVFLMTENTQLHYPVSKVLVSLLIGLAFNFPMHRNFVFR